MRSTRRSWPTMTRLISNSTRSSWAASADGGTGAGASVGAGSGAHDASSALVGCVPAQRETVRAQARSRGSLVVPAGGARW